VPTFESLARFDREFRRMPRELQAAFLAMLPTFIAALRTTPPTFLPALRVKRVQGRQEAWEITFAPGRSRDLRIRRSDHPGTPHIIWRRVGTHDVLRDA
jgi:hypothetical protein